MVNINTKQVVILIAVIALLIFLHIIGIIKPIENVFTRFITIPLGRLYAASTDLRVRYNVQTDKRDLVNEVKQLEVNIRQLTQENSHLIILEEENKTLRQALDFFDTHKYEYVVSNVISRSDIIDQTINNQTITIDKGSNHDINIGYPVISSEGIVVGKVFEVKENLSKVYLTINPDCKLAATLENTDKTSGVIEGSLGLTIKMDFIPQTEKINKNDIVITSGLEENIPRGLVIGKVAIVNKESNELWQTATVEPMLNFDELVIVSVLKE